MGDRRPGEVMGAQPVPAEWAVAREGCQDVSEQDGTTIPAAGVGRVEGDGGPRERRGRRSARKNARRPGGSWRGQGANLLL